MGNSVKSFLREKTAVAYLKNEFPDLERDSGTERFAYGKYLILGILAFAMLFVIDRSDVVSDSIKMIALFLCVFVWFALYLRAFYRLVSEVNLKTVMAGHDIYRRIYRICGFSSLICTAVLVQACIFTDLFKPMILIIVLLYLIGMIVFYRLNLMVLKKGYSDRAKE